MRVENATRAPLIEPAAAVHVFYRTTKLFASRGMLMRAWRGRRGVKLVPERRCCPQLPPGTSFSPRRLPTNCPRTVCSTR
jgi:hypothetical protein